MRSSLLSALVAASLPFLAVPEFTTSAATRAAEEPQVALARPAWKVGDTWEVETVTDKVQGREEKPAAKSPPIRWRFLVRRMVKIDGHNCFEIDIDCLAPGRVRPKTKVYCDADTLMLRQWETELALAGTYHTIRESYRPGGGPTVPVLVPLNALPIDLPAFLPQGAKPAGSFTYTSQPLPAESKDPGVIRFEHTIEQQVQAPGAKALRNVPQQYAKALEQKPIVEVRLKDQDRSVVQLWQKGSPWPVYVNNGRTEARLISVGAAQ
jgi:hypothetical protein